jgi:hypothetical protein
MNARTNKATSADHHRVRASIATIFAAIAIAAVLVTAPAALAAPTVTNPSLSEVTETSATFSATLDPHEKATHYAIQYITQQAFKADGEAFGAGTQTLAEGDITTALAEPHALSAPIGGLTPATGYRARLLAKSGAKEAEAALPFYTYAVPPPGLPDNRAYEQASPIDKNGGDVGGTVGYGKAAASGNGAIFGSSSGVPGGLGAQEMPFYAALRSPGGWLSEGLLPPAALAQRARVIGWAPDFSRFYQEARLFGEPETTALYEGSAGGAETQIAPYLPVTSNTLAGGIFYAYAGSSADQSTAIFESSNDSLDPDRPGAEGHSNLYAWDGSHPHLASVLPGGSPAPKGAFAGPYDWAVGRPLQGGAANQYYTTDEHAVSADGSLFFTTAGVGHIYQRRNPTAAEEGCADPTKACTLDVSASHRTPPDPSGSAPAAFQAASAEGDTAFFTSPEELTNDANTGPEIEGPKIGRVTIGAPPEEESEEELPGLLKDHHAVGIAVSGEHVYWADPLDGTIGWAKLNGSGTPTEVEELTPGETCAETHPETEPGEEQCGPSSPRYVALGPCAAGGQCLYWTNTGPLGGDLNKKQEHHPALGAGTIGRAELDGSGAPVPASVEPKFITGASNPQGIAVNSEHIYWADSLRLNGVPFVGDIVRSALDGSEVEPHFLEVGNIETLFGVALSATRVYWTMENNGGFGSVESIPLDGGSRESIGVGGFGVKPRGIAVIGPHLYWAAQGAEEIGRMRLPLNEPGDANGGCSTVPRCEDHYLSVGGSLGGLATDPSEAHLYWSANGEVPPHPGNDLYRFQAQGTRGCATAGGCLTDLTPDPSEEKGAGVKGLLGASKDGSRLYFAADGVLAHNTVENGAGPEEAQPGDCADLPHLGGRCNLYAWEAGGSAAGTVSFIARLDALGSGAESDAADWLPTAEAGATADQNISRQKTSRASADGRSLLFRSQRRLTAYDNQGTPELYLYRLGKGLTCVSCNPTLAPPSGLPSFTRIPGFGRLEPFQIKASNPAAVASRFLSASGGRAFFETTEALSPADGNGAAGCPNVGGGIQSYLSCLDVYEWEAPGEGSCSEGGPGYSPADQGCLFLISTGRGAGYPALLTDASETGEDVFFIDREGLVAQDTDNLTDLYDARVGGGIAAQNPPPSPPPCEGEACKPEINPPPPAASPATPSFKGTGNVTEKKCPKGKVKRGGRCAKGHKPDKPKHHHKHRRTHR